MGRASETAARPPAGRGARPGVMVSALRRGANWFQLFKFCLVGASGYVVNVAVYAVLVQVAAVPYLVAAVCSFAVAVANNYLWNRLWTFRKQRGHIALQGARFFVVSLAALGANLAILAILVVVGLPTVPAQAIAIVLVMPLSFLGNKLWSFRP